MDLRDLVIFASFFYLASMPVAILILCVVYIITVTNFDRPFFLCALIVELCLWMAFTMLYAVVLVISAVADEPAE